MMTSRTPRHLLPPTVIQVGTISPDWKQYMTRDGTLYYHNEKTKQTVWEKPVEMMDPLEKADALTAWVEYCTEFGYRYYFNKVTKESVWHIPHELQVGRELIEKASEFYQKCIGKNLNIYNEDLELGEEDNEDEETQHLCDWLQQLLHDKVDRVQVSKVLSSPCVLHSVIAGSPSNMQRVTRSRTQVLRTTTKFRLGGLTFEINPDHRIVNKLNVLLKSKPDGAEAEAVARFLYEVALICSGSAPKTPVGLYNTIYQILRIYLAGGGGKSDAEEAQQGVGEEANLERNPMEQLISSVVGILKF